MITPETTATTAITRSRVPRLPRQLTRGATFQETKHGRVIEKKERYLEEPVSDRPDAQRRHARNYRDCSIRSLIAKEIGDTYRLNSKTEPQQWIYPPHDGKWKHSSAGNDVQKE